MAMTRQLPPQPARDTGWLPRRAALALPFLAKAARADEAWPNRPVRLVIPFGAGGPIDAIGRLLAEHLRDRLGQPLVIENRPGAGGSIGIRAVVQSPPDGATFLLTSASLASVPALYPSQGLDPRRAMTPVSLVAEVPTAMVVRADGPYRSVGDVMAAAKARPATLTYGSGGVGSSNHLSGALFAQAAGLRLEHISYRGAAPAMIALFTGEIDMVFASTIETLPHVAAGRARLLGVATEARVPALPEVPAINEIVPGYVALNWYAIAGPRGLPEPVLARFTETLAALHDLPEIQARFAAAGTSPLLTGPEALVRRLDSDVPQWQRVVEAAGIKVE
ncbi:Bug family tripartite tricarboxylate transporter substrate binding protein [Siccirubricoccus phaeus]|uniref:Bug family tripartite tricarboxylate transporter substrate binding protein n=1 Tax=Siccirubricoccus phaeus TaxID=2595053 RepID=UPI00165B0C39|nr:tripartite tricarboxylate transporter substrate binding protein [Siccirubricoccus phaeus]